MSKPLTFTAYSPLDSKRYHDAPTHDGKFYRIREDKGRFEVRLCPAIDGNGSPVGSVFLKWCGKLSAAQSFANRHYAKASEEMERREQKAEIKSNCYSSKLAAVRLPYKD